MEATVELNNKESWIPTGIKVKYIYESELERNPFAGTSTPALEACLREEAENKALRSFAENYEKRGIFAGRFEHIIESIQDDHMEPDNRAEYWGFLFRRLAIYKLDGTLWVVPGEKFLERCEPVIRLQIVNGTKLSREEVANTLRQHGKL